MTTTSNQLFIGLMSGTSLDAIDVVLVQLKKKRGFNLLATHSEPISEHLKQEILRLCYPGENAINRLGHADVTLGHLFSRGVLNLLKQTQHKPKQICAIGSHGQTIRHMPASQPPFTLQIGDPNIIVANTGITTVADFRRRDLALGGQAAPLTPAFHNFLLRTKSENRWIVNIGGIANLTLLAANPQQPVIGFDTGPGNTLMDTWIWQHKKLKFDDGGQWAASGHINRELLNLMLADSYFQKHIPKSTGREYFNLNWLNQLLQKMNNTIAPEDIQATLLELTAQSIAQAIQRYSISNGSIWVCGGGAKNIGLIQRLQSLCCPPLRLTTTESIGIHPDWIEACAFAWLAQQTLAGLPGNLPSVTGAKCASILGCIYPGNTVNS